MALQVNSRISGVCTVRVPGHAIKAVCESCFSTAPPERWVGGQDAANYLITVIKRKESGVKVLFTQSRRSEIKLGTFPIPQCPIHLIRSHI